MEREILMVKIHNALKVGKGYYEATRGNWKISKAGFDRIRYVAGVSQGKVICVFEPLAWHEVVEGNEVGRKFFDGKEAPMEVLQSLQRSEKNLMGQFGSGQAIAYASLSDIE